MDCKKNCQTCQNVNDCKFTYYEKYVFEDLTHQSLKGVNLESLLIIPLPYELLNKETASQGKDYLAMLLAIVILKRMGKNITTHNLVQYLKWDIHKVNQVLNELRKKKYIFAKTITSRTKYLYFSSKGVNPNFTYVVSHYFTKFKEKTGNKPFFTEIDGKIINSLLKQFPAVLLCKIIDAYLELDDDFIKKTGYSLRFLPEKVNYIQVLIGKKIKGYIQEASDWQIMEYLKLKKEKKLDGFSKEIIDLYEAEIKKRNISEEDFKKYIDENYT